MVCFTISNCFDIKTPTPAFDLGVTVFVIPLPDARVGKIELWRVTKYLTLCG